jgi:MOSC domain-containing protein YiiM
VSVRVVSVNVGLPRAVVWKGRRLSTGIFKQPVEGRRRVGRLNLEGDRQADPSVHGGPDKAVYAYPCEHYAVWRQELDGMALSFGMFGENLTTEGLREDDVGIGDRFRIGSAVLLVTQPRTPCDKLAARFGRDDIVERFLASGRSGFYFRVVEEGEVGAGDRIDRVHRDEHRVSVADLNRLYLLEKDNLALLRRAVRVEALSEGWRARFQRRIEQLETEPSAGR